jgi:ribosomal protein L11 methyltransferase
VTSPGRWLVVTVRLDAPELLPLAAEALIELGGGAVVEEGDAVHTFLPPPDDPEAAVRAAAHRVRGRLPAAVACDVSWRWQQDEDWAARWKRGLAPRRVTERLVVKPSWTAWEAAPGQVVIDVDPQMAFGTGEHATTRGCLRLLDAALREGDRVLDIGAGSAILAIAAARLGAAEVVAVEYDPDANLNARENLDANGVAGRVRIVEAMADGALLAELGRFDLVLANILSGVIRPLLPSFHRTLAGSAGGRLIVSGILRTESADVVRDARAAGFRVAEVDEEEEWWSALLVPERA